jgi:hypothetical protein
LFSPVIHPIESKPTISSTNQTIGIENANTTDHKTSISTILLNTIKMHSEKLMK